jgi:hypothetical protein
LQIAASKYSIKNNLIRKSKMIIWDTIMKISLSKWIQGNQIVNPEDRLVGNQKIKVISELYNQINKIMKFNCSLIKIKSTIT